MHDPNTTAAAKACACGKPASMSRWQVYARSAIKFPMCDDCAAAWDVKWHSLEIGENDTLAQILDKLTQRLDQEGFTDGAVKRSWMGQAPEMKKKFADLRIRWISCFAVTGVSEGHYIHVDLYPEGYHGDGRTEVIHVALGKTFSGWDHAWAIAKRCAELLGA